MPPGIFRYTVGAGTPRRSITLCQEGWRLKKRTVTLLALVLALAAAFGLPVDAVSVKATTEEHLGFTGEGLGIAAHAVALIETR